MHSAEVSRNVCKWILKDGKLKVQGCAEGLHKAIRSLRDKTCVKNSFTMYSNPLFGHHLYILGFSSIAFCNFKVLTTFICLFVLEAGEGLTPLPEATFHADTKDKLL